MKYPADYRLMWQIIQTVNQYGSREGHQLRHLSPQHRGVALSRPAKAAVALGFITETKRSKNQVTYHAVRELT
jgi:hypothetical protein